MSLKNILLFTFTAANFFLSIQATPLEALDRRDNICGSGIYGELAPVLSGYQVAQSFCTVFFPIRCTTPKAGKRNYASTTSTKTATTQRLSSTTTTTSEPKSTTTKSSAKTTTTSTMTKTTSVDAKASAWSKARNQASPIISTLCSCIEAPATACSVKTTTTTTSTRATTTTKPTSTTTTTTESTTITTTSSSTTTISTTTTTTSPTTTTTSTTTTSTTTATTTTGIPVPTSCSDDGNAYCDGKKCNCVVRLSDASEYCAPSFQYTACSSDADCTTEGYIYCGYYKGDNGCIYAETIYAKCDNTAFPPSRRVKRDLEKVLFRGGRRPTI